MNIVKKALLIVGTVAALNFATGTANAQGNFDPEQFRQRMMERTREQLGVTNDDEWKIISERVEKVMAARRDVPGGFGGFGRGPGGPGGRRGGDGGNSGGNADRPQRPRFGPEESQAEKDLRAAIEAKAPADEVKAKLDKFRDYKKSKEAELASAQEKLKEVLNARQEAAAVLAGLLK